MRTMPDRRGKIFENRLYERGQHYVPINFHGGGLYDTPGSHVGMSTAVLKSPCYSDQPPYYSDRRNIVFRQEEFTKEQRMPSHN